MHSENVARFLLFQAIGVDRVVSSRTHDDPINHVSTYAHGWTPQTERHIWRHKCKSKSQGGKSLREPQSLNIFQGSGFRRALPLHIIPSVRTEASIESSLSYSGTELPGCGPNSISSVKPQEKISTAQVGRANIDCSVYLLRNHGYQR